MGSVEPEVARLAALAMKAGAAGVVCSPAEIATVKPVVGTGRIVVPGIRRSGEAAGDQARVAGPEAAVAAGATHLVVGRPITSDADPKAAYEGYRGGDGVRDAGVRSMRCGGSRLIGA